MPPKRGNTRRETQQLAEHVRDGMRNEQLIANMKKYTDMSDADVDEFAYFMVAADYFKQPDHRGGVVEQGTKHYRADGTEHTLADVPFKNVLRDLENRIKEQPEDRRTTTKSQMFRITSSATRSWTTSTKQRWEKTKRTSSAQQSSPTSHMRR